MQFSLTTFMTPISAKGKDEEKRVAAEDLILARNAEEPADIEVWLMGALVKYYWISYAN